MFASWAAALWRTIPPGSVSRKNAGVAGAIWRSKLSLVPFGVRSRTVTNPNSGSSVGAYTLICPREVETANNGPSVPSNVSDSPWNSVAGKRFKSSSTPKFKPNRLRIDPGDATPSNPKFAELTMLAIVGIPWLTMGRITALLVKPAMWSTRGCCPLESTSGTRKKTRNLPKLNG